MTAAPFLSSSWYRVARRRPKLRDHTSIHRHRYRGSIWYVVQDHATGRVHRLSPAGYMIVAAMDGVRTVDQLWHEAGVQSWRRRAEPERRHPFVGGAQCRRPAADRGDAGFQCAGGASPASRTIPVARQRALPAGTADSVLASGQVFRAYTASRPMAVRLAWCRPVAARGAAGAAAGGAALARTRRRRLRPHPCCRQHLCHSPWSISCSRPCMNSGMGLPSRHSAGRCTSLG